MRSQLKIPITDIAELTQYSQALNVILASVLIILLKYMYMYVHVRIGSTIETRVVNSSDCTRTVHEVDIT